MTFDGRHRLMDEEFKEELSKLIEHLLNPRILVVKKFNKCALNGSDFLNYITNLFRVFQMPNLPRAQTIFESTVERQLRSLVDTCFNNYKDAIKKDQKTVTNSSMIQILHQKCKCSAILKFNETKKMGNDQHHLKFKNILESSITKEFNLWKSQQENYLKRLKDVQEIREEVELGKTEELEFKYLLAQVTLQLNQMKSELDVISQEISKLAAIEKENKIAAIELRMHEEEISNMKWNARMEIDKMNQQTENELNMMRSRMSSPVLMKCKHCSLKVKFSELSQYIGSVHYFF